MTAPAKAEERNTDVLAVLRAHPEGLAPTAIAQMINKPWCCPYGPCSAPVSVVLKRIGATALRRGVWGAPAAPQEPPP